MASIQLALTDTRMANSLRNMLTRNTEVPVHCVDAPNCEDCGVLVVDPQHFQLLPTPLAHPERVVLIARNEPSSLRYAWEAGVSSVVSDRDPLNTVMLAILSACLRQASSHRLEGSHRDIPPELPQRKQ